MNLGEVEGTITSWKNDNIWKLVKEQDKINGEYWKKIVGNGYQIINVYKSIYGKCSKVKADEGGIRIEPSSQFWPP